jgi:hypothetical protein
MTGVATFAGIDRHPTTISELAARWLVEQLRDPRYRSDASLEATTTIETGLNTGGAISLSADSRRAVSEVLVDAFELSPSPLPDGTAEELRWLDENVRRSLAGYQASQAQAPELPPERPES